MKSPSVRSPACPPMSVFMLPRWIKCWLAWIGAVNVGVASWPFNVCAIQTLQSQVAPHESGPAEGCVGCPGVPYQAMLTRPSSPATAQTKTFVCRTPNGDPLVSIVIGAAQVLPWSVEYVYLIAVSPTTSPSALIGASFQTA